MNQNDALIPLPTRIRSKRDTDADIAQYAREIKKSKWLGAILAIVLGAGSASGVAYTTADRAKANELKVTNLEKIGAALEPRLKKTEDKVLLIDGRLNTIDSSIKSIKATSHAIAGGIEELKEKNVKRLERELETKEREIRRLERIARDR